MMPTEGLSSGARFNSSNIRTYISIWPLLCEASHNAGYGKPDVMKRAA
jgi:hypothetical protein